jgi:hypothetical protein
MTNLKITYDTGAPDAATLDEILAWREWSERERIMIFAVANGDLRMLSTSRDGRNCDVELAHGAI